MDFDGVFRLLEEQRVAIGEELAALGLEAERIAELIAAREVEFEELGVALRVVSRLPVPRPVSLVSGGPADPVASDQVRCEGLSPDLVSVDAPVEVFNTWVLGMLGAVGRPVRCQEVVRALDEDPGVPRKVQRVRHRLKKLAGEGLVVEPEPGMFTLPGIDTHTHG